MIRHVDLIKVVFYLLRVSYGLWNKIAPAMPFNVIYRYLLGCIYPLISKVADYEQKSIKNFALASNDGTYISMQAYLDYYYGSGAGFENPIVIDIDRVFNTYFHPYAATNPTPTEMYPYTETSPQPLMLYNYGSVINAPTIKIPIELEQDTDLYNDFVADVNALILYSLQYTIETY